MPFVTRFTGTVFFAGVLAAAPQTTTKTAATHKAPAKTVAAKRTKSSRTARRGRSRKPAAPSYQLHPDPERYAQIQQALIDRGYFKGPANGQWGDDSVDALKRFQADQKLDNDGKINAHSLTALGLGPRHDGTSASTVPLSAAADGASPAPPPELPQQTTPTPEPPQEFPPQ